MPSAPSVPHRAAAAAFVLVIALAACGTVGIGSYGPAHEVCAHFRGVELAWAGQGTIEQLGLREPEQAPDPIDRQPAHFYVSADAIFTIDDGSMRRYCMVVSGLRPDFCGDYDFCGLMADVHAVPPGWEPPRAPAPQWPHMLGPVWLLIGVLAVGLLVGTAAWFGSRRSRGA